MSGLFRVRVNSETLNTLYMWWGTLGHATVEGSLVAVARPRQWNTTHNIPCLHPAPMSPERGRARDPSVRAVRCDAVIATDGYQVSVLIAPHRSSCKMCKTNGFNLRLYFM